VRFREELILPGDVGAVRSQTPYGIGIQVVLGSYTNHNFILVWYDGQWWVLEAVDPLSRMVPLAKYAAMVTQAGAIVRIFRVPNQSPEIRQAVSDYAVTHFVGKPYPISVIRMVWYRFFNTLPFKIKGVWCTRIPWRSWEAIVPGVMNRPDGKVKKNETPRTYSNRLVAGVVEDVSGWVLA